MYEEFYGLERKPFEITPDPHFLYASGQHKEAFATLLYGVKEKKGLMVLTGEVGTGKTLLLRSLLQVLDPRTRSAYLFNPKLSPTDFFRLVAADFGLKARSGSKGQFLDKLNAFLLETAERGDRALLVLDEAHNLSLPLMEEVRMLMNLETAHDKLLQVILAGQPELHQILNYRSAAPFKQRISLRCVLNPLSGRETREYIERRLAVAGRHGAPLFTEKAVGRIHKYAGGIPRLINVVCDNALLTGYAEEKRQVDDAVIRDVIADLEGERLVSAGKKRQRIREEGALDGRGHARAHLLRWSVRLGLAGGAALVAAVALAMIFPRQVPEPVARGLQEILSKWGLGSGV
jgi:general secretion pathway protein A